MNGATAKANRRDIRRAFGDQAVGLIDTHAHTLKEHDDRLHEHDTYFSAHLKAMAQLRADHLAFLTLTLWQRLRWLLTGRLA